MSQIPVSVRATGGGRFKRADCPIYFIATGMHGLLQVAGIHPFTLIAVNELQGDGALAKFEEMLDMGTTVFLDSGIFNLTNAHKRAHDISMNDALALAPSEIDGFEQLYERYCYIVEKYQDRLWGYVELDQGGIHNKRKTRAGLEAKGYRPIPVYHPLNDGWEYFDELAKSYDRICVGNIVQAAPHIRKRLIATIWERQRQYPHLWVHLLGMTANQQMVAYPQTSCDSSSWIACLRWTSSDSDTGTLARFDSMPEGFSYEFGLKDDAKVAMDKPSHRKALLFAAMRAHMRQRNWRVIRAGYTDLGLDPFTYEP